MPKRKSKTTPAFMEESSSESESETSSVGSHECDAGRTKRSSQLPVRYRTDFSATLSKHEMLAGKGKQNEIITLCAANVNIIYSMSLESAITSIQIQMYKHLRSVFYKKKCIRKLRMSLILW